MDPAYEKLGLFYLGRPWDAAAGSTHPEPLLYDSRRLTTHALIVGMTGSGKTGLGIGLLEEAAIDGVPALIIDPKGDLANLALAFPRLAAEDFQPWVDPEVARRKGIDVPQLAAAEARKWSEGIAGWEQGPRRIERLRAAAEVVVYTPGSTAGRPLAVLGRLAAPAPGPGREPEARGERAAATASSLLGLLGIGGDRLQSREHIVLTAILDHHWAAGEDLDLGLLIRSVQQPPFDKLGALDLENVFPASERFGLALQLNNLLAAPGFAAWRAGDPLDVDRLLYGPDGRPRLCVLSIAHLGDAERMFFVSLLLAEVIAWMRTRPGTDSLRALLYMDEVFGFLPPVAEPPSKRPFLTLLKQARAFGLGLVLATQNPADLDYKALTNIGTWFLGRLQADRDKQRLLDGLEGAAGGGPSRSDLDRAISSLGPRVFLLHDVRENAPVPFQTRWTLSYLRGPMTREEIRRLGGGTAAETEAAAAPAPASRRAPEAVAMPSPPGTPEMGHPPVLPPEIVQRWEPGLVAGAAPLLLEPRIVGWGRVAYRETRRGVDLEERVALVAPAPGDAAALSWDAAEEAPWAAGDLAGEAPGKALYRDLPSAAAVPASYRAWTKSLADDLYRSRRLRLLRSPSVGLESRPGESERDFRIRLADACREERDRRVAAVRERWGARLDRLEERERRELERVAVQKEQLSGQKMQTAISFGAAVLGAFMGRGRSASIGRATTAAKSFGRIGKESGDVERAEAKLAAVRAEREEIEVGLEKELAELDTAFRPESETLETIEIAPRRSDVAVDGVALVWVAG